MAKRISFLLILLVFAGSAVYADEDGVFPKNTFTIDGLTPLAFLLSNLIIDDGTFGFGTAVQYERQFTRTISAAVRFEYKLFANLGGNTGTNMWSMSAEGHFRFYPGGSVFFLDGMLGYANFSFKLDEYEMPMSHYFKLGGRLGWRIDFGEPGGFVLEPSFGYSGVIGNTNIDFNRMSDTSNSLISGINRFLNQMYDGMIRGFFVGGPVLSIGLGYRF